MALVLNVPHVPCVSGAPSEVFLDNPLSHVLDTFKSLTLTASLMLMRWSWRLLLIRPDNSGRCSEFLQLFFSMSFKLHDVLHIYGIPALSL